MGVERKECRLKRKLRHEEERSTLGLCASFNFEGIHIRETTLLRSTSFAKKDA